jgi:hypothetical protein
MKKLIWPSLILFSLAACQKEAKVLPRTHTTTGSAAPGPAIVAKINTDTIPDRSAFKMKLVKDSINSDETMLVFNHKATCEYSANNDAPYFQGFGQVSLASVSSDGVDLSINQLPYTPGMSIGLDVRAKADGSYQLQISYEHTMPASIQVWLKDNYLKDSVNVCLKKYDFKVTTADTNSFGKKRFTLILKDANTQ